MPHSPGPSILCPAWGTEQRSDRSLSLSHRQLEQLEVKRSGLTKELVEVREALSCAILQREKAEVAEALTKVSPVSHMTHGSSH